MKRIEYFLAAGISAILILSIISGCNPQVVNNNLKIADIINRPSTYQGKTVTIDCKYGGWTYGAEVAVCDKGPQVTRSDFCVYDETGCIYTSPGVEILKHEGEFNSASNEGIGTGMTIRGKVELSLKGVPYLGG
jgi:hypothetical protein